jgi:hypothetical protein
VGTPGTTSQRWRASLPARTLTLAALTLAALSAAWSASASAAPYTVGICTTSANATDGLFYPDPIGNPAPMFLDGCGKSFPATISQGTPGGGKIAKNTGLVWELRAPEGARIKTLALERRFFSTRSSFLDWELIAGGRLLDHARDDRELPDVTFPTYDVNAFSVASVLRCQGAITVKTCPESQSPGSFLVLLRNIDAVLEDETLPLVPKPEPAANPARGAIDVAVNATDSGSGLNELSLFVDGVKLAGEHEPNGGKCQPPFQFVTPCKLEDAASFRLDTTTLADGQHELVAVAVDASGQQNVSAKTLLTVRNAPASADRPLISGLPRVGTRLSTDNGRWDGNPTAFSYQWIRCPATTTAPGDVNGCVNIPGAAGSEYIATEADAERRLAVQVTATSAKGVGAVLSPPTAVVASGLDKTAPLLKRVVLTRKRLAFSRPKGGATALRFVSNEAGKMTIAIDKLRRGAKPKRILPLAAEIKAGPSTVPLGPILAAKRLRQGSYQLTLTVRDEAGNLSEAAKLKFRVLGR